MRSRFLARADHLDGLKMIYKLPKESPDKRFLRFARSCSGVRQCLGCAVLLSAVACSPVAQEPFSELEVVEKIRVCSQNLQRYSARDKHWTETKQRKQKAYLIDRMYQVRCDVVALQELVGENRRQATALADEFAAALSARWGEQFIAVVGDTRDRFIRNGFVYRRSVLAAEEVDDLARAPLPRLQSIRGATGFYSRGPLFVRFRMATGKETDRPDLVLATMHFKSKVSGYRDASGTSFEILRMEMAEDLREEARGRFEKSAKRILPIILGDRNSDADSASAAVLEGRRRLADFRDGHCEITSKLAPKCKEKAHAPSFVALLEMKRAAQRQRFGSYTYRGKQTLIDDILVRPEDLQFVSGFSKGRPEAWGVGLEGEFYKGSDHKLLWVELHFLSSKAELQRVT